jgi:superfamily I DNA and/or RNA helicase
MFDIANHIAYAGLMVSARSQNRSPIRDCLGKSVWINIEGTGEDKWCQQEGEAVMTALQKLKAAGVKPDLYIISPFVIVAERMRQMILRSNILNGWVDEDDWRWVASRVGTVHTAQGREAEAIILILGAPNPSQHGARGWAGGRPNLLNVAVTRAKEALYVFGNRRLWQGAGDFSELDRRID